MYSWFLCIKTTHIIESKVKTNKKIVWLIIADKFYAFFIDVG